MARTTNARRRALAAPALLTALALGVGAVGCSSSSSTSSGPGSTTPTTSATSGSTPGTAVPADEVKLPKLTIKVKEDGSTYLFDTPATVEAGWVEVTLENNGKLSHQAGIGHPVAGKTVADIEAAVKAAGPEAALPMLAFDGGPNSVPGGGMQKVIVKLAPGEHVLYCMVPDIADGKTHVEHGMISSFTVVEKGGAAPGTTKPGAPGTTAAGGGAQKLTSQQPTGAAPTAEPGTTVKKEPKVIAGDPDPVKVEGEITMKDYGYIQPESLPTGWYKIVNDGPQPHELTLMKLQQGKTADEAKAWLQTAESGAPPGPPPFEDAGGFGAIDNKGVGYVYLDLKPGEYVAMCFIPDIPAEGKTTPPDFKPHFEHGMWQPFTVR